MRQNAIRVSFWVGFGKRGFNLALGASTVVILQPCISHRHQAPEEGEPGRARPSAAPTQTTVWLKGQQERQFGFTSLLNKIVTVFSQGEQTLVSWPE